MKLIQLLHECAKQVNAGHDPLNTDVKILDTEFGELDWRNIVDVKFDEGESVIVIEVNAA